MISLSIKRLILALICIGFLTYFPSLFGNFIWDDEDFVYQNQYVKDFRVDKFFTEDVNAGRGKTSNYYRPVQQITYSLTHAAVGFNPFFFHLLNIIVHIAASLTVFIFFYLISRNKGISFITSLIFLIHPLQTEAVSYVSGLSDPLYVLFGFLSLTMLHLSKKFDKYYLYSLLFFVLSILSKESGMVFLGLIIITALFFNTTKNKFLLLYPFFLITAFYLMFHFTFINKQDMQAIWGTSIYANSIVVRMLTFFQNIFAYIGLMIFPKDLFMERDYTVTVQKNIFNIYLLGFLAGNAVVVYYLWLKRKTDNIKFLVFSYLGFFATLSIYSGIVLINGIFYEHFLYLPLVFFFSFFLFIVKPKFDKNTVIVISIIGLILVTRSYFRQWDWINNERFYLQTLERAPESLRIHNNLGMTYADSGKLDLALNQYQKGLQIDPTNAVLYHNIANVYLGKKDFTKAEEYYKKAIQKNPRFYFSYVSLINLYKSLNQPEKAEEVTALYNQQLQK